MLTSDPQDNPCALTAPPYFNSCQFWQAHDILRHLYGELAAPAARLSERTLRFDQRAFAGPLAAMSATGYAYVPAPCTKGNCRVHIAFHGCQQGVSAIGSHFYGHAGYNELADTNRIIVLYPQIEPSYFYPYNPTGCWDFWGYTDLVGNAPTFHTHAGRQMAVVRQMLGRLAQARPPRVAR